MDETTPHLSILFFDALLLPALRWIRHSIEIKENTLRTYVSGPQEELTAAFYSRVSRFSAMTSETVQQLETIEQLQC